MKQKSGFTLIEIVIVLIILGVLATLALSNYFSWIERSKTSQAAASLKNLADLLDACISNTGSCAVCAANFVDPGDSPYLYSRYHTADFKYQIQCSVGSPLSVLIQGIKADSAHTPIYYTVPFPDKVISCGGNNFTLDGHYSRVSMCRNTDGTRTMYDGGAYSGMF